MDNIDLHAELMSKFFYALSNPSRYKILLSLLESEKNVSELVDKLEMKQAQVSNQLNCLKTCGFVTTRKEGKYVFYGVSDPRIKNLLMLGNDIASGNSEQINSCLVIKEGK